MDATEYQFSGPCEMWQWFKSKTFEHMLRIKLMRIYCEIALRLMPQNTFDDKSTLVQEAVLTQIYVAILRP